jgi:aldose 1-epimerase
MTLLTSLLALSMLTGAVTVKNWGSVDGRPVHLYTLTNSNGMRADITNYGATVVRLFTRDRSGALDDVVTGFDNLAGYRQSSNPFFGCTVGRYANRIGGGRFRLDGRTYRLPTNNGPNTLHGGNRGFDKRVWTAKPGPGNRLTLRYVSPHGEEGFPGQLTTQVVYTLTDQDELKIDFSATTTRPTVVSLTNHSYFNLAGKDARDAMDHVLRLESDYFTPVDKNLIPTGKLQPVLEGPFDFRVPTPIGQRIDADHPQLKLGGGYDHNFVVRGRKGQLRRAAQVTEPTKGRIMEVWTTEPGIQLYTGNFLDGTLRGKGGTIYPRRYAFCLETQHFPDSPNKPQFPSAVLRPGQRYASTTIFRFQAR